MEFDKTVLVLAHSDYLNTDAGVEKIMQGQQKLFLENQINFVVVYPIRKEVAVLGQIHEITTSKYGLIVNGQHREKIDDKKLTGLLGMPGLKAVIVHELVTFRKNEKLFELFDRMTCPVYYYVHDYAMVCYSHTLMKNNREFCGTKPLSLEKCKGCKYYLQGKLNSLWQHKFVKRYPKITYIFPSEVVREIWKNTFSAPNRLLVVPNTKFGEETRSYAERDKNTKIRIAFIGYGRVEKGWNIWKKICEKFDRQYDLYVLGDGDCEGNVTKVSVSVSKDGPNAMVDAICRHNIDIAFLWSTRPETYSYTFYESYVSGCYVITGSSSGNIAAMTKEYQCGAVFETEEELFAYLECEEQVRAAIDKMYGEKKSCPTALKDNDEILKIIKGEQK